ncbi:SCO family protein [Tundrisphaera sp. TA3]|uniref:SCO family protein n=1 Tax=Tundrisphaera sp. TA3 TaxID=3435775 RepID=UPI003EC093D7
MNRLAAPTEIRATRAARPRRAAGAGPRAGLGSLLVAMGLIVAGFDSAAVAQPGGALADVKFDQKLDSQIPLTLKFRDESGREVQLSDYFGRRPVILTMSYADCPLLCSQVLGGLARSLRPLRYSIGKEFDVINVSIDPNETPERALKQKTTYVRRYNREGAAEGWHFLTGDKAAIASLARSVGFQFSYSAQTGKYAHAAGMVFLTKNGRVSRYIYGVEPEAREIEFALMDSSIGKIGSPIKQVLLFCYDYDPATGKYTFAIMNVIRALGIATALTLGGFLLVMLRRDRRMARASKARFPELPPGPVIS